MDESAEGRLGRIEGGLVHLHSISAERHGEVMGILRPLVEEVQRHRIHIAILRRDRKWLYGIGAVILTGIGYAIKSGHI